MRMRRPALLAMVTLPALLGATAANANSYPGLYVREWSRNASTLTGRVAIEVNDLGQGRARFRLQCEIWNSYYERREPQWCDFYPGVLHWYDLTTGEHYQRADDPVRMEHEVVWVGTYRTLKDGHTYAVKAEDFWVYFLEEGFASFKHRICTYRVTWHAGGTPSQGTLYCSPG